MEPFASFYPQKSAREGKSVRDRNDMGRKDDIVDSQANAQKMKRIFWN